MVQGGRSSNGNHTVDLALHVAREAQLPVLLVNPTRKIIEGTNKNFETLFGWEQSTLKGQPYRDLVPDDDHAELRNLISVLAYGGAQGPLNAHLETPDGSPQPVTLVGVPNILENPTDRVALICRPRGKLIGKPIKPPSFLRMEKKKLARIPPRQRTADERRMNSTSRNLWG